jgi:hypothetical protein
MVRVPAYEPLGSGWEFSTEMADSVKGVDVVVKWG